MPIPLFVPLGAAGLAAFAAFAASKKSAPPINTEALKATKVNLQNGNYEKAAASALASGSEKAVAAVADALRKAGSSQEARDLIKAGKELAQHRKKHHKRRKHHAAVQATKPAPQKTTPAQLAAQSTPAHVPAAEKAAESPMHAQAVQVAAMLKSTGRYHEDKAQVSAYQSSNSLTADGKYGPTTAKSFWTLYKILPVNPFYWPKSSAAALADYRKFLEGIKLAEPGAAGAVAELERTLGK